MTRRRGRGDGSIYRRQDGRWAATMSLGVRAGKRVRKTFYGSTRAEVQSRLSAALRAPERPVEANDRETVASYLTEWLEIASHKVEPSTARRYAQIVRQQLIPHIGHIKLLKLTPEDVERMLYELARTPRAGGTKPLAPRTIHHCRAVLRRALAQAVRHNRILRNAAQLAEPPRVESAEVQYLGVEDSRRLLAIAGQSFDPLGDGVTAWDRLAGLYVTALTTGARQGELLALRWEDVDLEGATMRIRHSLQRIDGRLSLKAPKTAQSRRTINLPPVTIEALRAHRARQAKEQLWAGSRWSEAGFVFTTTIGTPLSGPRVTMLWHRFSREHGLPIIRFHALRHSAASIHLAAGTPERVVSDLLGHSTTRLLNVYQHVADGLRQEAADRMQSMLGSEVR